jgi:uncharacterized SAM-binding protein YcdF (DUF218 family)
MIRHLIVTAVIFLAFIFGLSFYLQSDDLAKCDKSPSLVVGCEVVDAIVAISGGDTNARTAEAIDLYKNGWAKQLVFSGAAEDQNSQSNAIAMKNIAVNAGVPESAIQIDEFAKNTQENAKNSNVIFNKLGAKKVILVTSGYHQRRAGLEFNRQSSGVKIINHPDVNDKDWSNLWWLSPNGWYLAMSEMVKIIVFYVTGIIQ